MSTAAEPTKGCEWQLNHILLRCIISCTRVTGFIDTFTYTQLAAYSHGEVAFSKGREFYMWNRTNNWDIWLGGKGQLSSDIFTTRDLWKKFVPSTVLSNDWFSQSVQRVFMLGKENNRGSHSCCSLEPGIIWNPFQSSLLSHRHSLEWWINHSAVRLLNLQPVITRPGSNLTPPMGWLDTGRNIYLRSIMHEEEHS